MLVILTNEQILSPQQVCGSCLLAGADGHPRWQQGKLGCRQSRLQSGQTSVQPLPNHYRCQMGFEVAQIDENRPEVA